MIKRQLQSHLAVGQIIGVHGIRGELKVDVMTDFPERFEAGSQLWIEGEDTPRSVVSARWHKGYLLLRLSGLEDRTAVEPLRERHLLVPRQQAHPLPTDTFYEDELLGLQVISEDGESLGVLSEVLWTAANEVYVVQGERGEILLPAIADVVLSIDLAAERMVVRLLPGLEPE